MTAQISCSDIYKKIPVPTYIWQMLSGDMVLIDYNEAALEYSGQKLFELLHKTAEEVYNDQPCVLQAMEECFLKKRSVCREIIMPLRTTGQVRCLNSTWTWIDPDLILFHAQDHTAVKQAQLLLEDMVSQKTKELKKALDEIKVLRGILPICMYCKGIRDEEGAWKRLEDYLEEYSDAKFTHGICDKCMKENFPEEYYEIERKKSRN